MILEPICLGASLINYPLVLGDKSDEMKEVYSQITAVTGGIGSGKSTVCNMLKDLGAALVSADELARKVVEPGSKCVAAISSKFGDDFIKPDNSVDREKLAKLVFSDLNKRTELESILHPEIQKLATKQFSELIKESPPLIVYDCPLFFEAGLNNLGYKSVVVVESSRENCIERAMQRLNLSRAEVESRIDSQLPLEQKCAMADYVVENNSDLPTLKRKVTELFARLSEQD